MNLFKSLSLSLLIYKTRIINISPTDESDVAFVVVLNNWQSAIKMTSNIYYCPLFCYCVSLFVSLCTCCSYFWNALPEGLVLRLLFYLFSLCYLVFSIWFYISSTVTSSGVIGIFAFPFWDSVPYLLGILCNVLMK